VAIFIKLSFVMPNVLLCGGPTALPFEVALRGGPSAAANG